jgi:hypothetical protein
VVAVLAAAFAAKLLVQVTVVTWPRVSTAGAAKVTVRIVWVPDTTAVPTVNTEATPVSYETEAAVQVVEAPSAAQMAVLEVSFTVPPAAATSVVGVNFRTRFVGVEVAHKLAGTTLPQVGLVAATRL